MQDAWRPLRSLIAWMAIAGIVSLGGCSDDVQQVRVSDVSNRSFLFASGAVFNPGLTNVATTLAFSNNAANFTLSSAGGTVEGTNTFGSCTLTVTSDSPYPIGTGPQRNDAIRLDPCDYDIPNQTLLVGNRTVTAVSAPGVVRSPTN